MLRVRANGETFVSATMCPRLSGPQATVHSVKGPGKRGHIVTDTLLSTQMFPRLPTRATFVADTNFGSRTQKMFLILFRNILCPDQMFPSLRSPRNIMSNNVSPFARALKAQANEDTLLRTQCCRHKCFPVCPRAQHLLRTKILCPGHKKYFWFCSETFCVRNKRFPVCTAQETSWATMRPQQCVLVYQGLKIIPNHGQKSWDKCTLLALLHTRQTRIQLRLPNLAPSTPHTMLKTAILPDLQHCAGWGGGRQRVFWGHTRLFWTSVLKHRRINCYIT